MPATNKQSSARRRRGEGEQTGRVDGRLKQVLFVQGGGADTHDGWDDKLVASLREALGPGYTIRYPRMPDEGNPEPAKWKQAIADELGRSRDGVVLVGHSVGAAILLDYLGRRKQGRRIAGLFLIATPYIGDGGWPSEDLGPTRELGLNGDDATPLFLYQGTEDDTVPVSHVEMLAKALPRAVVRRLEGRNHQLDDDLSEVARDIRQLR